ncbi:MAG TPA: YggT family protein [Coriobacteriia bacterium]|nr:YggT family protein [Coriobacteriia bacterium]
MLVNVLDRVLYFYSTLIIIYVLMSWFPVSGVFEEIYRVLGSVCEPYLGLFRRIIPPIGMIDISPIVAILVLNVLTSLLHRVL